MTTGHPIVHRLKDDNYVTPVECVKAFLQGFPFVIRTVERILDPGAGSGNIGEAVRGRFPRAHIYGVEKRKMKAFQRSKRCKRIYNGYMGGTDYLSWPGPRAKPQRFDLVIMNPPYKYAQEFVQHAQTHGRFVAALLRLDFLASIKRADWLREMPPSVYVLPRRPSFTGDGQTDWYNYAWLVWEETIPIVKILHVTDPKAQAEEEK